ncbi:hypothetical protein [Paracoccus marinaquae]|uniref:Integrase n=1 Tax=Paracoccus marinaquae TaxID=2841926 RepID=A0ABS6ARX6_9RHOB|nr:hypothetical protein [Paracoccus marinaquae]MBU3032256.1 hypothetical protein [Paracoccus marinaquae]
MTSLQPLPFPSHLSPAEEEALAALYRRGTPENTLRAWERDLAYITAWKDAAYGAALDWPEQEAVALRFVLDHAADLTDGAPLPAAMQLSLHRSLNQAQQYYADVDITKNPATDLLG